MSVVIDETRVEAFVNRIVDEIGAAVSVPLTVIGARLGLYAAMADGEPVTPAELARRTRTYERYIREWLAAQAAGGYVEYDAATGTYALPIEHARANAAAAGVEDRVRFEIASATNFPGEGYDLVACFDSLHDLGDPAAAAAHVRSALAPNGTWLIVEPQAGDTVEENLHPLGRIRYSISTLVCTPGPLSQPGRAGLGTLAGEARLSAAIRAGGFSQVRRATETPLNMVLEARP